MAKKTGGRGKCLKIPNTKKKDKKSYKEKKEK